MYHEPDTSAPVSHTLIWTSRVCLTVTDVDWFIVLISKRAFDFHVFINSISFTRKLEQY